jgi:cell division protein FtsB
MRAKKNVDRPRAGILIKVVVVMLLVALGWKLYDLRGQIVAAEEEKARYAAEVAEIQQANAALEADIEEGPTDEKLQDIARDELGFVKPGEYVFDPTN